MFVVTSLETDAFMAIVANVDKLMVKSKHQREVEKRSYPWSSWYSEGDKSKVVHLETQIQ